MRWVETWSLKMSEKKKKKKKKVPQANAEIWIPIS